MNREIELLIEKNTLKGVELWLNARYVEIDKELAYLDAKEDKIREVADEVKDGNTRTTT